MKELHHKTALRVTVGKEDCACIVLTGKFAYPAGLLFLIGPVVTLHGIATEVQGSAGGLYGRNLRLLGWF